MARAAAPDPSRATRFPRGHCGRAGCLCTHTEGCDHGWVAMPPRQLNGQRYVEVAPCPICRPEAMGRMLAGSITVPELQLVSSPAPPSAEDLPPELWQDQP